eukprot:12582-Heterococcus_DN1.PRE.7
MLSFKAALVFIAALVDPVRGSSTPFHLAFPVHDLGLAKEFYGDVLGLSGGRSSKRWQQSCLVASSRCTLIDDADLRIVDFGHTQFLSAPEGQGSQDTPGEQWTMFFKDPSGNNLEFKAMVHPENLFTKYNVDHDSAASGDEAAAAAAAEL